MDHQDQTAPSSGYAYNFHGEYERAVDAKGRFNLPFRFRRAMPAEMEERYMVTRGPDGSLAVMPHEVWLEAFNRLRKGRVDVRTRNLLRSFSRSSHEVVPDNQGRIAVPSRFLEEAGIEGKVAVVGMGDRMELWSPEKLQAQVIEDGPDIEDLMDEFFR